MIPRWLWRAAWLLVPAAWAVHHFAHSDALTFAISCLSLVPLARTMGNATEELAERMGPATGSLLNATFGNAAELIIGISALRHGHVALVKGSLTGSILGNLLLVAGASIVVGGVRFSRLRFNRLAASSSVSTLFLAVVAMVVPTLLSLGGNPRYKPALLSFEISAVLITRAESTGALRRPGRAKVNFTRVPRSKRLLLRTKSPPAEMFSTVQVCVSPRALRWATTLLALTLR